MLTRDNTVLLTLYVSGSIWAPPYDVAVAFSLTLFILHQIASIAEVQGYMYVPTVVYLPLFPPISCLPTHFLSGVSTYFLSLPHPLPVSRTLRVTTSVS